VQLEPAYISLCSQKVFTIVNKSEEPVKFSWAAFAHKQEEAAERTRLHAELSKMEELEQTLLLQQYTDNNNRNNNNALHSDMETDSLAGSDASGDAAADSNSSEGDVYCGDEAEEWIGERSLVRLPPTARAALSALKRKYRHLRRALNEDAMLFADDSFELRPLSGEVWANSSVQVTAVFKPNTAADYACCAYLEVVGREHRAPLWLGAKGIGPRIALSYDVLDLGDLFVGSSHKYELTIINRGDIAAQWSLQQSLQQSLLQQQQQRQRQHSSGNQSQDAALNGELLLTTTDSTTSAAAAAAAATFADMFTFSPTSGELAVGDSVTLTAEFCSTSLGEFAETFEVALQGCERGALCMFRGSVVGPTFAVDATELVYGAVSYGIAAVRHFTLTNTSAISMDWSARVPQDGGYRRHEFELQPENGHLNPGQSVTVAVQLLARTLKTYSAYFVTLDVASVGEELLSLPVRAVCAAPLLRLRGKTLAYGDCFLRHHESQTLVLVNTSTELTGMFKLAPQEPSLLGMASIRGVPEEGIVPPGGTVEVEVWVTCERLGQVRRANCLCFELLYCAVRG
jgi:hydrocephalus-inducing protein